MCSIEIIKSIRGGKVLSVNNFLYILNKNYKRKRDNQNVFYWTCSTKYGAKIFTKGKPNNVPSRNPPLFSPDNWSISNRVKLELPRTTNTAESWHRNLNRLTSPHPGLHKFITILQKILAETET